MLARDDMITHTCDVHPWSLSDDVGAPGSTSQWSVCHVLTCVCVRVQKRSQIGNLSHLGLVMTQHGMKGC